MGSASPPEHPTESDASGATLHTRMVHQILLFVRMDCSFWARLVIEPVAVPW